MSRLVVIGASRGGVTALISLASALPGDFPWPILVTQHIGRRPSILPSLINGRAKLSASHGVDGEVVMPGRIYIAPPDHHMLIRRGRIELSRGPKVNWSRPGIDPMFRSAAEGYGRDTIGIVLTGDLNDGTAGLLEIERRGGITVIQDPAEAEAPSMPTSCARYVQIDYCLPLDDIAPFLVQLTTTATHVSRNSQRLREYGP
jgi:two-component system chemotaxis response regulator CheB